MEIERLKTALSRMEDPRRTVGGHILHKLEDIIIIGLCTLLCNGEDFTDMEAFGKLREEWLRKFLELPDGIPDSDTFRRVFERINPEALSECLYDWLGCHWEKGTNHLCWRIFLCISKISGKNCLALLQEIRTMEE